MFVELAESDPFQYLSWVGFAAFSICCHESAHAWVAVRLGDKTPQDYIRLNPARQMGWLSLIMLLFVGVAWGAVPVNPRGLGGRRENATVYLAGPAANLALCAVFALLSQTAYLWELGTLSQLFHYGSYVNGALCLLNLFPVPPLDGFGILRSLCFPELSMQGGAGRLAGIGFLLLWVTPLGGWLFQGGGYLATFFLKLWMLPFTG